jgi:hypothetical protein
MDSRAQWVHSLRCIEMIRAVGARMFHVDEGSRDAASSVAGLSLSAPTWTRKTTAQTDTFWADGSRSASSRRWSRDDERKSSELDASIGTGDPIERLSLENVSLA